MLLLSSGFDQFWINRNLARIVIAMLGLQMPTTPTSITFCFQVQKTLILWIRIYTSHIIFLSA